MAEDKANGTKGIGRKIGNTALAGAMALGAQNAQPVERDYDFGKPTSITAPVGQDRAAQNLQRYQKPIQVPPQNRNADQGAPVQRSGEGGVAQKAGDAVAKKAAGAAVNEISKDLDGVDIQGAKQSLSKFAKGDVIGAANEAFDTAAKAWTNYLFLGMLGLIVPSIGTIIIAGDIVWVIARIAEFFTGKKFVQMVGWQKATLLGLNLAVVFILLIIFLVIWISGCTGVSGFLLGIAGKVGAAPEFCAPLQNLGF